ncbi:MAG: DUF4276 family protein [Anaerolineae bacterium]|jgi:hypothetical protein|nr:DUF4276 family protein [Anaerolineae bacterium]
MVYLEFFVEESSMEVALKYLIPRILEHKLEGEHYDKDIRNLKGKDGLLRKLPDRLQTPPKPNYDHHYLFILVDRDNDDCRKLKQQLETIAQNAGLITRSANPQNYRVVNRIVIEELEAWYFGDIEAIKKAYPKYKPKNPAKYRNPDDIKGGTCDALGRELAYYYPDRLPKIPVAEQIAPHMNPHINQSKSFQVFRDALLAVFS